MFKARNERMTLEQQIQPLVTKDIRGFFPTMVCPTFRHFGHLWHFPITARAQWVPRTPSAP